MPTESDKAKARELVKGYRASTFIAGVGDAERWLEVRIAEALAAERASSAASRDDVLEEADAAIQSLRRDELSGHIIIGINMALNAVRALKGPRK